MLLTGFTPFGGDTDQETFHNICHGQLDFPDELFEDVSAQAEDFIRKTLTREPRYVVQSAAVIPQRTDPHRHHQLPVALKLRGRPRVYHRDSSSQLVSVR